MIRIFTFGIYIIKTFLEGCVRQIPQQVYGNSAGLKANFGATRELNRLRKHFIGERPTDKLAVSNAAKLEKFGYVALGKVSSDRILDQAVAIVSAGFKDSKQHVRSPNGASKNLIKPEKNKVIQSLLSKKIIDTLVAHYGCAIRINTVRVWRNINVPSVDPNRHDVFSNTFHHDNNRANGLRVFILLKDGVTRDTGAFRFHDKQVSQKIIRSFGYFHRFMQSKATMSRLLDAKTLHYFEGDAGDCVIVNTQQCLHAASVPKEKTYRDILQFEVYPDSGNLKSSSELFDIEPDLEIESLRTSSQSKAIT